MIHFQLVPWSTIHFWVTVFLTASAVRATFVAAHDHGVSYPNGRVGRRLFRLFHKRGNPHG